MRAFGTCFLRRMCGWAETSAAEISCIRGERSSRPLQQAMAPVDTRVLDHTGTRSAGVLQLVRWMATERTSTTMWSKKW
jgi:hypothetical protein